MQMVKRRKQLIECFSYFLDKYIFLFIIFIVDLIVQANTIESFMPRRPFDGLLGARSRF